MLSSFLNALLKLPKTSSLQKLIDCDCVTLYVYYTKCRFYILMCRDFPKIYQKPFHSLNTKHGFCRILD